MQNKRVELEELRKQTNNPDLWADPNAARELNRRVSRLSEAVDKYEKITRDLNDYAELMDLVTEDSAEYQEMSSALKIIDRVLSDWEFQMKMGGPDDIRDCILTIHAGAGGTESADWAAMLMRMYLRYFERRKYKSEVIDLQDGEQAGIKSATIEVQGDYSFGRLKAETGVHRLVRLSPFDSSNRRHTSFASVFVYPMAEESGEIEISPNDLRIDTFRASGAGGQHVNKTESAIRITHLPTQIVVNCQSERSQHKNRESAMKILRAKLLKLQREEEAKMRDSIEANKTDIGWGSQIRSYVLHPYKMVKDLRTDIETSDTDAVLDGDLDMFIEGYLMEMAEMKI